MDAHSFETGLKSRDRQLTSLYSPVSTSLQHPFPKSTMSQFLIHIPNSNSPFFLRSSSPSLQTKSTIKTLNSKPLSISIRACSSIPARDRVIDFGKYKGRMLGSLPSTYLKWVSANLRARDFEDWAKLADQVLVDPVYQDRVEWEFAQKVLNGDVLTSPLSSSSGVSSLLEISERFGWDNEDKLGWRKLNFELLGTSNGGRIPRIKEKGAKIHDRKEEEEEEEEEESGCGKDEVELGERRGERRERLKLKRGTSQRLRVGFEREEMKNPAGKIGDSEFEKNSHLYNRFPGREGLLRRVMNAKGKRPSL